MTKSIKAFIIASVLLNLLLAGVIFGHASKRFMRPPEGIIATLPQEKRALYEDAMDKAEAENKTLHEAFVSSRRASGKILRTEPFDRAAYMAEMQKAHEIRGQMMQRMANSVAELAGKFTPEERAILAKSLRERAMHKGAPPPPPPPREGD